MCGHRATVCSFSGLHQTMTFVQLDLYRWYAGFLPACNGSAMLSQSKHWSSSHQVDLLDLLHRPWIVITEVCGEYCSLDNAFYCTITTTKPKSKPKSIKPNRNRKGGSWNSCIPTPPHSAHLQTLTTFLPFPTHTLSLVPRPSSNEERRVWQI